MKKLALLLTVATFAITSCNQNAETPAETPTVEATPATDSMATPAAEATPAVDSTAAPASETAAKVEEVKK